jgi:hypothetical protein
VQNPPVAVGDLKYTKLFEPHSCQAQTAALAAWLIEVAEVISYVK